jgi:hypothetical protein
MPPCAEGRSYSDRRKDLLFPMEHVSKIVARTVGANGTGNGHVVHHDAMTQGRLAAALSGRPGTLPDLLRHFEAHEARENPDVTVPLSSLTLSDTGLLRIPQTGEFSFTDWSRRQAAGILGIRFDRWFANAAPKDRAEEMNRRFARATESVRLRTMRPAESGAGAEQGADGILRAFVSPGYSVVRDSAVAKTLLQFLDHEQGAPKLVRIDMTDRSTSYVVAVGVPYKRGGAGAVGDVWGGILIRNSGVGFASLIVTLHLTRLLCMNGMTAPLPDALLLKKRHRGFQEAALMDGLRLKAAELPGELGRGVERLLASEARAVPNVEAEITDILRTHRLPSRLLAPIMAAYGREPIPSAFGVSQAITLAAQSMTPEERLDLERAAGRYLADAK